MAKSNVYTRTGDAGTTSLVGGERVKKNSIRLESYGTVDEFSSQLGIIMAMTDNIVIKSHLTKIQNKLFNVGGYLATQAAEGESPKAWGLSDNDVAEVENWIDTLDEQTPKIRAFVLPGGCLESAQTHVARTVCRRAERRILDLCEQSYVDPTLIGYINRLSDYLFVLARYFNHSKGVSEIIWNKDI